MILSLQCISFGMSEPEVTVITLSDGPLIYLIFVGLVPKAFLICFNSSILE